jgi:hypothetical protein
MNALERHVYQLLRSTEIEFYKYTPTINYYKTKFGLVFKSRGIHISLVDPCELDINVKRSYYCTFHNFTFIVKI